ncbi:MAG: DUF424 domain-containing protein [Thaumarchaeota archaeon]|nr:MAG: DUF424 domain-containing protein [Nitrososphaerota archaeon]
MSDRFWIKLHHSKTGEIVLAVCDEELLGKRLKLNERLSIEVSQSFYGGVLIARDDLDKYLKQATIVNMLGEKAVSYAMKKGFIVEKAIMRIGGVPHIQLYL